MTHLATDIVAQLETLARNAPFDEQEAKDIVNDVGNALDDLDDAYAKTYGWTDEDGVGRDKTDIELLAEVNNAPPRDNDATNSEYLHDLIRRLAPHVNTPSVEVSTEDLRQLAKFTRHSFVPAGVAIGGATFEAELRWALDAIKRGHNLLATDRIKRILKGETHG